MKRVPLEMQRRQHDTVAKKGWQTTRTDHALKSWGRRLISECSIAISAEVGGGIRIGTDRRDGQAARGPSPRTKSGENQE
jgi:hypothetical protein